MDLHSHNPSELLASHIGEPRMRLALDFFAQHPQGFDAILKDHVEQEPVLDHITDLEIRRDIFVEFQALAREDDPLAALNGISLGIIMVAPIDGLRLLLGKAKSDEDASSFYGTLDSLRGAPAINGIRAFMPKGGHQPSLSLSPRKREASETLPPRQTPPKKHKRSQSDPDFPPPSGSSPKPGVSAPFMPPPGSPAPFFPETPVEMTGNGVRAPGTPKTKRKVEATSTAKERDGWRCVLSGMEDPEAAHLFPFSTTEKQNFPSLNQMLKVFWGIEKADKWAKLFESIDTIESARNLICLNHQLHRWFGAAKMALKPLRVTDEGAVVVQFHWLKGNNLKPQSPLDKPFDDILEEAELSDNQAWGDRTAHRASVRLLQTGQTFVIGAEDRGRAPSFQLLQLSWDLLRVAAISGAALPGSLDAEDSDGGDCFGVEDDEGWGGYGESDDEE